MRALGWLAVLTAVGASWAWWSTNRDLAKARETVAISQKIREIDANQIRDLLYDLQQMKIELEMSKTRHFVTGVTAALAQPDLRAIWHAGYDQANAVRDAAAQTAQTAQNKPEEVAAAQ